MRVERYLKGRGPRTVRVQTAITIERNGTAVGGSGPTILSENDIVLRYQ